MHTVARMPIRLLRRLRHGESPIMVLSLAGVATVSVIGFVLLVQLRDAGMAHERREAERETWLIAEAVVAPSVTREVIEGDAAALAELDRVVRHSALLEPLVRVKLWAPDGAIVYSDEARLIGRRFPLAADEREILANGGVTSQLSDLSRPENRFERRGDRLMEVYTRIDGPTGPMLFEGYQRFESIAASGSRLWLTVLPALLGGLLFLQLTNFGLARWFAGRIRRRDQQRAALLGKALDASNTERRRIAADLHDGVVQDLTAASVVVAATTRQLDPGVVGAETLSALEGAGEVVRESIGTLRTLLIDFYPADLEARGFAAALGDLVTLARTRGLVAELDVPPELQAPVAAEGLLFRVAQEALRNAAAHSHGARVCVSAGADGARYWLSVSDDGDGFDPTGPGPAGHIGLRVVRDLVGDAGGRLSIESIPGQGTIVRAELPVT